MTPSVVARASRAFPPERSAVRDARAFALSSAMCDGTDHEVLAIAVSELATNAVLHAETPFVVSLERLADGVRVTVTDDDPTPPQIRSVDLSTVSGRGLGIVQALSRHLRIESSPTGKAVSFELDWIVP